MADRPVRDCALCDVTDDHPRHTVQINRQVSRFHQDCHAAAGCPDCAAVLKAADGAHGEALTAFKLSIAGEG